MGDRIAAAGDTVPRHGLGSWRRSTRKIRHMGDAYPRLAAVGRVSSCAKKEVCVETIIEGPVLEAFRADSRGAAYESPSPLHTVVRDGCVLAVRALPRLYSSIYPVRAHGKIVPLWFARGR